jgi:hypothetical protein
VPTSSTSASSAATAPWSSPARAIRSSPSRSRPVPRGRSTWRPATAPAGRCSLPVARGDWTGTAPPDRPPRHPPRRDRQARRPAHPAPRVHHRGPGRRVPLRDVQEAASHADPRTTMRYDRARTSLDRHATYIVATYIAGAAR